MFGISGILKKRAKIPRQEHGYMWRIGATTPTPHPAKISKCLDFVENWITKMIISTALDEGVATVAKDDKRVIPTMDFNENRYV